MTLLNAYNVGEGVAGGGMDLFKGIINISKYQPFDVRRMKI